MISQSQQKQATNQPRDKVDDFWGWGRLHFVIYW